MKHTIQKVSLNAEPWCTVCHGFGQEGLTTQCSGVKLAQHSHFAVIESKADYMADEWTGTTEGLTTIEARLFSLGYTYEDGNNTVSRVNPQTRALALIGFGFISTDEEDDF